MNEPQLEKEFNFGNERLNKEQLIKLVKLLQADRDAWITNTKNLQKAFNELETKLKVSSLT